ncbi:winged helix-turn-helix transcriptional regulator [Ureibacillus sp. Re31]|uniref:Winged helix-turn-helix transcriptional regulator n=1 Tax=Ureibacillus galli TaxID=2762222 RepID=A0ABR8XAS3_9BACL|nr:metalloregulator ArsR/SmtB family transcription factor [Ureibacillus galli]MBD8026202.1 winged helix-turn-helix transcriptional regulator [Ureibacillus galli]
MDIPFLEKQLKALADKNRLIILSCLKSGEVCVCDLVEVLGLSQPAVSQQLKKLEQAEIVTSRKVATWKHYRIVDEPSPVLQAALSQLENKSVYHYEPCY